METICIWGIKVNPLSINEIVELIDDHISHNETTFQLTGVNPETITLAQQIPSLKKAINSSDLVSIDNMLVVTFLRLLGFKIPERAACPDVFEQLLLLANHKGYSVFFLGAKEEILNRMTHKLKLKYPRLNIIGSQHGYYKCEEEISIVKEIEKLKPDMLFIALPTPQKELFINNYKNVLGARFAFGIGGAFDCLAGKVKRAPSWLRNIGFEGFHRALQSPPNYGRRWVLYNLKFLNLFFRELSGKKSRVKLLRNPSNGIE